MTSLRFEILPDSLTVHRFGRDKELPAIVHESEFLAITRTDQELSLACSSELVLDSDSREEGWRAMRVAGPLDFGEIGILAGISAILAEAGISIFVISTFDTDYILVKSEKLEMAVQQLQSIGGHSFS